MKNNGLMQVTIEVGRCIIPRLPYAEYALTVRFSTPPTSKIRI
jgi:hypothetical protein